MEEAGDTPPKTSCRAASPTIDHLTTIRSPNPPSNAPVEDLSIVKRLSDMSPKVLPVETIPQDVPGSSHASASQDLPENIEEPEHKPSAVIQTGDALPTHDGRYYCDVALECGGHYLDRKCDWNKHMKKQVRPYQCLETQCQQLQGFKRSGGPRRHEREAHGKHGGPKETLKCTVVKCKRGEPGKGFKRKDNLNEHLRGVHGITATSGSQLQTIGSVATELAETLSPHLLAIGNADESSTATTGVHSQRIDLESELQKLKANNVERDKRIFQLEERDVSIEARLKSLEQKLAELAK